MVGEISMNIVYVKMSQITKDDTHELSGYALVRRTPGLGSTHRVWRV